MAKSVVSEIFGSLRYRSEGMAMHPVLAYYASVVSESEALYLSIKTDIKCKILIGEQKTCLWDENNRARGSISE